MHGIKQIKAKSQINCIQNFDSFNGGVPGMQNSNNILNRRKQYRNVPAGNKLEQLSHPGHPSHPMYQQNYKQMAPTQG